MVSAVPVLLFEGNTLSGAIQHLIDLMDASVDRFEMAAGRLHRQTLHNAQLNRNTAAYIDVLRSSITGTIEYRSVSSLRAALIHNRNRD